jgi:hypothetical protein
MEEDNSDLRRIVQNLKLESDLYIRHLNFTLAGGAAAGLISLLSFAGGRKNAAEIILNFAPSYICFLISLFCCGLAIFFKSKSDGSLGEHYAASHNRYELNAAIGRIPEVFSSPQRLADEANIQRNSLVKKSKETNESSELAWTRSRLWRALYIACFLVAFCGFIFGAGWPLFYVLSGGLIGE